MVERGVIEDDVRGLAAEFEGELPAGAGEEMLDDFSNLGGAGEGDLGGEWVIDDGCACFGGTCDDIDDAGRESCVLENGGEL